MKTSHKSLDIFLIKCFGERKKYVAAVVLHSIILTLWFLHACYYFTKTIYIKFKSSTFYWIFLTKWNFTHCEVIYHNQSSEHSVSYTITLNWNWQPTEIFIMWTLIHASLKERPQYWSMLIIPKIRTKPSSSGQ